MTNSNEKTDPIIEAIYKASAERQNSLSEIIKKEEKFSTIISNVANEDRESDISKLARAVKEVDTMIMGIIPDLLQSQLHLLHLEAQIHTLREILVEKGTTSTEEILEQFKKSLETIVGNFKRSLEADKSAEQ